MAIEPGRRIRVVIAEDHPLYRDGLVRAISSDPQLELIGEAPDGLEAERLIAETEPDVALLDVKMPGAGGIEVCERIAGRGLATRVVMLSAYLDPNLVAHALEAGASAYLGKDASREDICDAIARLGEGVAAA